MQNNNMRFTAILLVLLTLFACKKHKGYRFKKGFKNDVTTSALFVVNGGDNSISVIDLSSDEVIETLPLHSGNYPHHLYFNPSQTLFAVGFVGTDLSSGHQHGSSNDNSFQLFDAVSGKHKRNVFTDAAVHNAVFSPDGKEIWIGQAHGDVHGILSIYSSDKGKWLQDITVGKGVSEITFSTDGTKAYACNALENTVSILDVSTKKVVTTIDTPASPIGAWPAKNGKMYVDCESGKSIVEIDVASNEISSIIPLNFVPAYALHNSLTGQLWVTDTDNGGVQLFEKINQTWIATDFIATGANAHAIAFTSDGKTAYVSNQNDASISKINAETATVIKTISVGKSPNGVAILQK